MNSWKIRPFRSHRPDEFRLGISVKRQFAATAPVKETEVGIVIAWWVFGFRHIPAAALLTAIDPLKLDNKPEWKYGTNLQRGGHTWRYARAGEDIKAHVLVEPGLAGRVLGDPGYPPEDGMSEMIYGDVRAINAKEKEVVFTLGWPEVDVPKGACFWVKVIPPGAELVKEEEPV